MRIRLTAVLALTATFTLSLAAQTAAPATAWPRSSAASQGVKTAVLDSIAAEITRGDYGNIDRMVVIRRGRLIFDRKFSHDYDSIYGDSVGVTSPLNAGDLTGPYNYYNPWWHPYYRRGSLHTLQSVTKTVTSIIIGVAVTRGDFPSIDTPVLRFFDSTKVANIDDRKRKMTVRHLLTMTGGFQWNENLPYVDPRNDAVRMEASHDWVNYVINLPMEREPGQLWNYSSGESELLAHIFRQATGRDIEEYGAKYLFGPLGIRDWYWKRTPTGLIDTEGGLYLEATDLARLWSLFLRDGMWGTQRVVSSEWVQQSVHPATQVGNRAGGPMYGLKWWLYRNPTDTSTFVWGGSGFGGQFPLAFPERDLVVVFNGWNILPGGKGLPLRTIMTRLVEAVPPITKR